MARAGHALCLLLAAIGLGLFTFLVFAPALEFEFVAWDDDVLLLNEERWRGFGAEQLQWMATTTHMGHWQPLTWLSYALEWRVHGLDERVFHRDNVLLHSLGAALCFLLAWRLLSRVCAGASLGARLVAAWCAAAVFAVHPLRVESVAWVTERRDVLCGVFLFSALLFWDGAVRAEEERARGRRRLLFVLAHLAIGLSLMAKAWAIVLPAVLLVLDGYPYRRWSRLGGGRGAGFLLLEKFGVVLLGVGAAAMAARAQGDQHLGMLSLTDHPLTARIAQAAFGLCFYAGKTFWPSGLSPLYELPLDMHPLRLPFLFPVLAVASLLALTIRIGRRWPAVMAVAAVYAVVLSPVLGVAQSGPQLVADRYSYFACVGLGLLVAGTALRFWVLRAGVVRWLPVALAGVVLVALTAATRAQLPVWRNTEALWLRVLDRDPNCHIALYNYGTELTKLGRPQEGVDLLRQAIQERPDHGQSWLNLGAALELCSELEEARSVYEESLAVVAYPANARRRLAEIAVQQDRLEDAVRELEQISDDSPVYIAVRMRQAELLRALGRYPEAVELYRWLLERHPRLMAAREGLRAAAGGR